MFVFEIKMGAGGLGLIGFVFPECAKTFIFIILCYKRSYVHLSIQQIGFDWVRIGFVFTEFSIGFVFIIHCYSITYVHLSIQQIGFVLHNWLFLIDSLFQPRAIPKILRYSFNWSCS